MEVQVGNYSKLIGSLVGGILGFAVAHWGFPSVFDTPEAIGAITILVGAIATWAFPANKSS